MRKKVLGLVMAALAVSTFGAFAQTENQAPQQEQTAQECKKEKKECKKECTKESKECTKEGKECKKGKKDGKKADKRARLNPFEGIELTADQQQQIDQLKADRKAKKDAQKSAKEEARKADRDEFNNAVEKILTPEQYQQYKANCEKMKAHKGGKAKADKKGKKMHKGKKLQVEAPNTDRR